MKLYFLLKQKNTLLLVVPSQNNALGCLALYVNDALILGANSEEIVATIEVDIIMDGGPELIHCSKALSQLLVLGKTNNRIKKQNIMKEVIYNSTLHFEHEHWKSELAFWKDELKSFKNRLGELVTRWTDKEVLAQLEHYQNEFILHGGVIEDLQETIEKHELNIAGHSQTGKVSMDVAMVKIHLEFRNKMEDQRQIYADLKKEFFRFLSKYM